MSAEGFGGLFRGYAVSLLTYGSNSGLYWMFYSMYTEIVEKYLPDFESRVREPMRIGMSGVSASMTACMLTNPLDVIRTRLQLQVSLHLS